MDPTEPPTLPMPEPLPEDAPIESESPERLRYRETGRLGAGAMGEVSLCEDRRIGREVALEVATGQLREPALRARFVREARIQAQLEHPSIVPVYDIGRDANGDPYFTMKRVRGLTLRAVIEGLRKGDPPIDPQHYTRRRLLTAFATICLTVHYAHTRGVLHRDPSRHGLHSCDAPLALLPDARPDPRVRRLLRPLPRDADERRGAPLRPRVAAAPALAGRAVS